MASIMSIPAEEPPHVLVVDDNEASRETLQVILAREPLAVHCVDSGPAALAFVAENRVDVMLLDVMMPGRLDGFAVCRAIKDNPELAKTFIVMLTARGQPDDLAEGQVAGADAYMAKPCALSRLVEVVEKRERSLKPARITAIQGDRAA